MIHTILTEMCHTQPNTPLQVDNSCAYGIINSTMKQNRCKAIEMSFYWLQDHECQGKFHIHWRRGTDNIADYFTKNHSPLHHCRTSSKFLLHLNYTEFELEVPWKHPSRVFDEGLLIGASSPPIGYSLPPTGYPSTPTSSSLLPQGYSHHKLLFVASGLTFNETMFHLSTSGFN